MFKNFFNKFVSPGEKRIAQIYTQEANDLAESLIQTERIYINKSELTQLYSWDFINYLEVQLLWGFFYSFAMENKAFPTDPRTRARVHFIAFMMYQRGESYEDTLELVSVLTKAHNMADPLFIELSEAGEDAYYERDDGFFAELIYKLHDNNLIELDDDNIE